MISRIGVRKLASIDTTLAASMRLSGDWPRCQVSHFWIAPGEMVFRSVPPKMLFKGSMPYGKCKAPESSLSNAVAAPDAVIRLISLIRSIRVDLLLLQLGTQP